jgi:drug/metabolite transporter (DMT)-like permease
MLTGAFLLVAVASPSYGRTLPEIDGVGWAWIVFTASINYPFGRLLLFQAMRRVGVAKGNTIVSASPAISAVIAIAWLGESIGIGIGIGVSACVGGAVIVAWAAREGPTAQGSQADPHLSQVAKGIAAATGAMIAYGCVSVLIKKLVSDVTEPITAASLVFAIGTGMVGLMALPRLRSELPQFTFRRVWLLVLGGTGMSLGILLFYSAASRAPIIAVAPIISLSPLIAIAFSQIIARRVELIDKRIWAGAASVVSGVVLIAVSL